MLGFCQGRVFVKFLGQNMKLLVKWEDVSPSNITGLVLLEVSNAGKRKCSSVAAVHIQ